MVERAIVGPDYLGRQEWIPGPRPPHGQQIGGGHFAWSFRASFFWQRNIVVWVSGVVRHLPGSLQPAIDSGQGEVGH